MKKIKQHTLAIAIAAMAGAFSLSGQAMAQTGTWDFQYNGATQTTDSTNSGTSSSDWTIIRTGSGPDNGSSASNYINSVIGSTTSAVTEAVDDWSTNNISSAASSALQSFTDTSGNEWGFIYTGAESTGTFNFASALSGGEGSLRQIMDSITQQVETGIMQQVQQVQQQIQQQVQSFVSQAQSQWVSAITEMFGDSGILGSIVGALLNMIGLGGGGGGTSGTTDTGSGEWTMTNYTSTQLW